MCSPQHGGSGVGGSPPRRATCPTCDRATHSAASPAVRKLLRLTHLPPRHTCARKGLWSCRAGESRRSSPKTASFVTRYRLCSNKLCTRNVRGFRVSGQRQARAGQGQRPTHSYSQREPRAAFALSVLLRRVGVLYQSEHLPNCVSVILYCTATTPIHTLIFFSYHTPTRTNGTYCPHARTRSTQVFFQVCYGSCNLRMFSFLLSTSGDDPVVAGDVHVARAEVGAGIAPTIRAQRVPAVAHLVVHQLPGDFLAELCRPRLLCVPRLQATGAECCLRVLNGATGRR